MNFLKNLGKKALHGAIPAAGAAVAIMLTGGVTAVPILAKAAIGAFIGYFIKPARPATNTDK
jgi:hypothetical protein